VASSAVIRALPEKFPSHRVLISTTTSTGQKLAAQRFGAENVFYFPLDFAFAIQPYLDALRPELVVVAETEFWPNFLRLAKQGGARIAVINCRFPTAPCPATSVSASGCRDCWSRLSPTSIFFCRKPTKTAAG
jgi:3-deoxy-D-manno-octulosonic-acid transferase